MKKKILVTVAALLLFGLKAEAAPGEISKIDFKPGKNGATLTLHYQGRGRFRVFQSEKQSNVIVEADNLTLPARLTRLIDSSVSQGPVLQVTPYSSSGVNGANAKFVVQLRGKVTVASSESGGKFTLNITGKSGIVSALDDATKKKIPRLQRNGWSETDKLKSRDAATEKGEDVARKLIEVLNSPPEQKNYFGTRVTFEGNGVDVHDLFRLVGEASGLNIITDSDVTYSSNYSLKDIPWDQVLDIAVQQAQLRATVSGNVIRIATLRRYTEEQEAKMRELDIADVMEPVVMAVVPLSFATAEDMKKMIETMLIKRDATALAAQGTNTTPTTTTGNGTDPNAPVRKMNQDFVRGEIQVDSRSNSLVITNTRDTIERIRKLIKELDVALPQVLIDAKVVIATESFSKSVGVLWGGSATGRTDGVVGIGGGFNSAPINLSGPASAATYTISPSNAAGSPGGAFGIQVGAGRHGNLNAQVRLAELNGLSRSVASPRIIVNNKKKASIIDGQTQYRQTTAGANSAGELKEIKANLELGVTPQVTSVGSVLLDITLKKDQPVGEQGAIENKSIETQVLVDSGSTLVLGGVYQLLDGKSDNGIPLLKDLPFIGQAFRTNSESRTKNELMVFITPQIIEVNGADPAAPTGAM